MMEKILIIEDDPAIRELLLITLKREGYEPMASSRGQIGFSLVKERRPSLILLDLMLPDIDGIEIFRRLQKDPRTSAIPVIMLTAKGEEEDRIRGLEWGAADYVVKPFSPRELCLRIKNILGKTLASGAAPSPFRFGALYVDPGKPQVLYKNQPIGLTPVELKLLVHLFNGRGRVQEREQLLNSVWGYRGDIETRTVDAHVKRLREKLGEGKYLIETIRGIGYRFRESS